MIIEKTNQIYESFTPDLISLSALVISIIALIYTIRTFFLKRGLYIRANYTPCSSIECEDKYIAHLTLENLKDKSAVIFKIYLKMANNYYLELEDHSKKPLIIGPFEVYQNNYEPIIYYSINTNRIKLDDFIYGDKYKKQIVLSTTEGLYKVKAHIKRWDPVVDFFNNYMTAIIHPMRMSYKDKAYGVNTDYLIDLTYPDKTEQVLELSKGFENYARYSKWDLKKEDLESKENILKLFKRLKQKKILVYDDIKVIEFRKNCEERYKLKSLKTINAEYYNYFYYKIFGKIYTFLQNRKTKRINRKRNKND